MPMGDLGDLLQGLQNPGLVVGVHDGNQDGLRPQCAAQLTGRNQAVTVHIQIGDLRAILFQEGTGIQHCLVFGFGGDDVIAFGTVSPAGPFKDGVDAFGGTRGPDQVTGFDAQGSGYGPCCIFHSTSGQPAIRVMAARRVPEVFPEVGQHGIQYLLVAGGGGIVVQIGLGIHSNTFR